MASRSRLGVVVCDPLVRWGTTGDMGAKELLDAIDHAERASTGKHRALWERLACRAQALLPDLTAPELCRALFGFHRARYRDEGLCAAACEAMLDAGTSDLGGNLGFNNAALLLKALSKHKHRDALVVRRLLAAAGETLSEATAADISQLLSAVVRLGFVDLLREESALVDELFDRARAELDDAYLPAADLTNLCAVAALAPSEGAARFLHAAVSRRDGARAPPRDVVRRLGSALCAGVAARLEPEEAQRIAREAAESLSRRAGELDPETGVAACEALAGWRAPLGAMRPLLAQALQRLPGLAEPQLRRLAGAARALGQLPGASEPLLAELLALAELRCPRA